MNSNQERVANLKQYVQGLMNNEDGKELYTKYKKDIEQVMPQEVFEVFFSLTKEKITPREVLVFLDKVINVFYKGLKGYAWEKPSKDSFLGYLLRENQALTEKLEQIKNILKAGEPMAKKAELTERIRELQEFNQHYLKKENILFPYLEKRMEKFAGLAIMWALHDEARALQKLVLNCLEDDSCDEAELNALLGSLFFAMLGLVKKEELILFPAATEVLEQSDWDEMQRQSLEYGFPYIEKPAATELYEYAEEKTEEAAEAYKEGHWFKTETGLLSFEQILMIFNALPVDLTFVDENNKVKFFTRPKDRIFPRSAAIIGRDVEKCHPPESVHVVNKITEAFRAGQKDTATFWINLRGKMLLIQYFALRDFSGSYKGVLEVSQDITEIKALEGERRLLNWEL